MWEDHVAEEVRKVRQEIEKEAHNDIDELYKQALDIQDKLATRLVSKPLKETPLTIES